jgi:hypothetical protein
LVAIPERHLKREALIMRRLLLVLALGLVLVSTGCIGRRVDGKEEIDKVLNQVMQAIVKEDVVYLEQVLVPDLESSLTETVHGEPFNWGYDTNMGFLHGFYQFGTWNYTAAQLTARIIEVTGDSATAEGVYGDTRECKPEDWRRESPLRAELRYIGGKWKVTKLEFFHLVDL